jgi:glycine/D-amino acid oxidase-like deaminating enzyme
MSSNHGARSIIVIGAGVFGVTAALELRRRGWRVTVVDPGPLPRPAAASTDISKVVRMDYGADELYSAMGEAALSGWDRWNAAWGSPLYHQDGFLLLTTEAMQPGGFEHESFELLRRRGHAPERIRPGDLDRRFTGWDGTRYRDGYFNARAGWVESGKVLARLAADAAARGVLLAEGVAFDRLLETGDGVAGIRTTDSTELRADVVLVAAGAWTPALLPHLLGVMWTVGQPVVHLTVERAAEWQAPRFPVWAADISRTGWYGFPALADGTLKIGRHGPGRRVHPDEPRTVLPSELSPFREFVHESLPALSRAPIAATRLCLYCDTFDGDFWIDRDPERAGLVVAAGDSGHGFKFAPLLGPLIADVVERRPNAWSPRFAWRARVADGKEAARAMR